jgi:hypothetical protein
MLRQHCFYLRWIYIETPALKHLFQTPNNVGKSLLITVSQISCPKPAIPESIHGRFREVPVSRKDVGTTQPELPDFARLRFMTFRGYDASFGEEGWLADEAQGPGSMFEFLRLQHERCR